MSLFVSKTFCLPPFMEVFNNNSIYKKETSFIPLRANSSRSSAGYVCVHVCVCVCVCVCVQMRVYEILFEGSFQSLMLGL